MSDPNLILHCDIPDPTKVYVTIPVDDVYSFKFKKNDKEYSYKFVYKTKTNYHQIYSEFFSVFSNISTVVGIRYMLQYSTWFCLKYRNCDKTHEQMIKFFVCDFIITNDYMAGINFDDLDKKINIYDNIVPILL